MALISCPKCNAEVSSLSLACPACGASLANLPFSSKTQPRPAQPFFDNFWGILTAPQTTFQQILEGPRGQGAWVLLFLSAFISCLGDVVKKGEIRYLLVFPLVALFSYLVFLLVAWIFSFTGKWIGGEGDSPELFDYLIWSLVPSTVVGVLQIIRNLNNSGLWGFGWGAAQAVAALWGFIICFLLLATAQRFSVWHALLNMFLTALFLVAPFMGVILLMRMVLG
jgi:hypothetical protein